MKKENKKNCKNLKKLFISKKLLVTMICCSIVFSFTACADKKGNNTDEKNSSAAGNTTESTIESSTGNTTTDQIENSGENQGQGVGWNGESWSEEMETIKKGVVDALGENYWPDAQITQEMLEGSFGINSDLYEDYFAEMPMISANVDTLIIIKAKQDKVEEVTEALEAYRDRMINDTMQYPMNIGKVQSSIVEVIDNYVCFIQLGAETDDSEEVAIEQCKEQNQMALEAIRQAVQS